MWCLRQRDKCGPKRQARTEQAFGSLQNHDVQRKNSNVVIEFFRNWSMSFCNWLRQRKSAKSTSAWMRWKWSPWSRGQTTNMCGYSGILSCQFSRKPACAGWSCSSLASRRILLIGFLASLNGSIHLWIFCIVGSLPSLLLESRFLAAFPAEARGANADDEATNESYEYASGEETHVSFLKLNHNSRIGRRFLFCWLAADSRLTMKRKMRSSPDSFFHGSTNDSTKPKARCWLTGQDIDMQYRGSAVWQRLHSILFANHGGKGQ